MKRTTLFVAAAFLLGLGVGLVAHGVSYGMARRRDAHTADLAAIERLHKPDVETTLRQDTMGMNLW